MAKNKPFSYEYVKQFFEQSECVLVTETYTGTLQRLEYICVCGKQAFTSMNRSGRRGFVRCLSCTGKATYEAQKSSGSSYHNMSLRKAKCLEKYGVDSTSKLPEVKEKMKNTNIERYGFAHVLQVPEILEKRQETIYALDRQEIHKKRLATLKERYGVESLAYLSNVASKQSQDLFFAIYEKLPENLKLKTHFAKLNAEFVITHNSKNYKYDFVISANKKAIEYNGFNFHPREDQDENETNWCAFHPNKTVKEAREYEKEKYSGLESRGYKILTVWDYEAKDFESLVQKCLDFILS